MTGPALHVTLQSADDITPDVLTSLLRRHDLDATVTGVTVGHTGRAPRRTCTSM